MRIELLYFDGCPNHEALAPRLRDLLDRAGIEDHVTLRRVESVEDAERQRFLGSPTLRIDGHDVEPGAEARTDFGLNCRLYHTPSGIAGAPPDDMVLRALGLGAAGVSVPLSRSWTSRRVEGLSGAERAVHHRVLRAFSCGEFPTIRELAGWAEAAGASPEEAITALDARDLVHHDPGSGAITVAYPFSGSPTAHRVRLASGVEVFAMCAIDALGIAFMLGTPTRVISAEPGTGESIEVSVAADGTSEWSPREAVVVAGCVGTGDSADCSCPHTNFVASPGRGKALLAELDGCSGHVLSIAEAIESGRQTFGTLLSSPAG